MEKRVCWIDAATETRDIPINPNAHKWEEMSAPTKTEAGTEWGACPHNNSLTRAVCISIASLRTWLSTKNINIAADPYNVALKVDDLGGASSATASLGYALRANESKYLSLDLSGSKLTGIGDKAFNDCETLAAITMPDSVTRIGASAFYGCTSLTAVTIPDSVTSIESYAFSDCSSLAEVTIPDSLTSIGNGAFGYCHSLAAVTIPNSVTGIGRNAFRDCSSLTAVTIPDSVTSIEWYAFFGCTSLTSVTFKGTIASSGFINAYNPFYGDLRAKFYATNSTNGTPGTYTTTAPVDDSSVWTRTN
jgi:hypothetical protein